jgi:hypothetical protein
MIQCTQRWLSIIGILLILIDVFQQCVESILFILEYHFNNYWIIIHIVLPNIEPYNKLFTTTEDDHLMAETHMVYQ